MRGIFSVQGDVVEADRAHQHDGRNRRAQGDVAGMGLHPAVELPDQPCAAQQRVTGDCAQPGEEGVRREPIPPAPGIGAARNLDPLQQRAKDHPLRHRRHQRSAKERCVPEFLMRGITPAVFKRHAPEHQAEQHRDNQRIGRGKDDGIGERKGRKQPAAAQHQPRLVSIPYRRDGIHRPVAALPDAKGREQDADAQIKPVHHHIGENGKGDDEGPDDGQVHHTGSFSAGAWVGRVSSPPGFWVGPGVIPAVRIGPTSPRLTPYSPACGALPISLRMYHTPIPNTVK